MDTICTNVVCAIELKKKRINQVPQHVHKYQRITLGNKGYVVLKCALPKCKHYIRRELAVGRASICWKCGMELILTMQNTNSKKPIHEECKRTVEAA